MDDMRRIANWIDQVISAPGNNDLHGAIKIEIENEMKHYPLFNA